MDKKEAKIEMAAGKYPGMPREEYDMVDAVNNTTLQAFVRGKEKSRTRTLLIGNALHDRMVGANTFRERYETIPNVNLTTKEGKRILAEAEEATGKEAIRKSELDVVVGMFKAVCEHPIGRKYVEAKGEREITIIGHIGNDGNDILPKHTTMMKGIVDLVGENFWDLKTTGWPTRVEFRNNIVNYGYDAQIALYRELLAGVTNGEYKAGKWLCVGKTEPYDVWVEEPTNYMVSCGLRWINTALTLYERAKEVDTNYDKMYKELEAKLTVPQAQTEGGAK